MVKIFNKISIKKQDQVYLLEIIKKYPGINSGRKNYKSQYKRILKNLLMSQAYQVILKRKSAVFFGNYNFKENDKYLSIKFKIK